MGIKAAKIVGRNEPCPCGSELKHKRCHLDPEKLRACNTVANMYMMRLIAEERKKRGLDPYLYKCPGCGQGTDTPKKGKISTLPLCPNCEDVLEKAEVKKKEPEQELKPEKKNSIILEA